MKNDRLYDEGCLIIILIVIVVLLFKFIVFCFKEYTLYSLGVVFAVCLFISVRIWIINDEEKRIQRIKDAHPKSYRAYILNSSTTAKKEHPSNLNKKERREILKIDAKEWDKWDAFIEKVNEIVSSHPEELLEFINKNHMYPSWDIKPKVLTDKLLLNLSLTNILKIAGIAEEEWIAQRELKVLVKFYPSGVSEYKKVNPNASTLL